MLVSLQSILKTSDGNIDYEKANLKLNEYLKTTKKISSGKSRIIITIYDSIKLIESTIIDDKDYGYFEDFLYELLKIDPMIYEARLFYAKALYANNKIDQAIEEAKNTIKISALESDSYRLLLKIFYTNKNYKDFSFYCNEYINSEFGGSEQRYYHTKLSGFNLNEFEIKLYPSDGEYYSYNGINQNKISEYEIIPNTVLNLDKIEFISNFVPGTSMNIKNIKLFTKDDFFLLNKEDVIFFTDREFLNNKDNSIIFISNGNQKVTIQLKKNYNKIDKITFDIFFEKLSLTNQDCN